MSPPSSTARVHHSRLHGALPLLALFALSSTWLPGSRTHAQAASEATPAPGAAEPSRHEAAQARSFFEIGAQAYERGDYQAALAAFGEAYARVRRPGLLFSMAQAHRRAFFATSQPEHLTQAIAHYRRYLETGDAARRQDAEDALLQLVPLAGSVASGSPTDSGKTPAARLMVASSTPGAVVRVDGVMAPHLPYVATVPPGTHTVRVSAPGFRDEVRTLPLPEGAAFALDVALEELPGLVRITGTPEGQVWLDGRLIGELPLPPLTLSAGSHQISVLRRGYRVETRRLAIMRGEASWLDVQLEHTPQRHVAQAFLATSGAFVLASVVTTIASHDRQQAAAELWHTQESRAWSEAEAARYERLLDARDRLRRTALGFGGAGLGCLLVGAALLALDRPEVPALLGDEPRTPAPGPKTLPAEIIAGPMWDEHLLGLEAQGRF